MRRLSLTATRKLYEVGMRSDGAKYRAIWGLQRGRLQKGVILLRKYLFYNKEINVSMLSILFKPERNLPCETFR